LAHEVRRYGVCRLVFWSARSYREDAAAPVRMPSSSNLLTLILNALGETKPLFYMSRRLLADVIERGAGGLRPFVEHVPPRRRRRIQAAALVALEGATIELATPPPAAPHARAHPLAPGMAWSDPYLQNRTFVVRGARDRPARIFRLTEQDLRSAFGRSIMLRAKVRPPIPVGSPQTHDVWISERRDLGMPLEALTQLLAGGLAYQFGESVALVDLSAPVGRLRLWQSSTESFIDLRFPAPAPGHVGAAMVAMLQAQAPSALHHVFYFNAADPQSIPAPYGALRFDRVVCLTDRLPTRVPATFIPWLKQPPSDPSNPLFGSFIPTLVSGTPAHVSSFATYPALTFEETPRPRAWRLQRDQHRLDLPFRKIRERWHVWKRGAAAAGPSFPRTVFAKDERTRLNVERWGRAVTHRLVGIALSGGGASSYRLVPILRELVKRGVPIDVVSGVSGGALLGAYFCKYGSDGLARLVGRGPLLQLVTSAAALDSALISWLVDYDLGWTRLEDLAVRFAPVATASRQNAAPEPRVIIRGRLGQAVRASGSAAIFYSPTTIDGVRYLDGSTASPVPAEVLPYHGADLVFAFNSIPGPGKGNPFEECLTAQFLYRYTPVGRVIDYWVSLALLIQEASRAAAEHADVFFEAEAQAIPFYEAVQFACANRIAKAAAEDYHDALHAKVDECVDYWDEFKQMRLP
jgi:predicted acylesterase/phospholipase RssA